MGRFSSIVLILFAACGDNLDSAGSPDGVDDVVDPDGIDGDAQPRRYVPQVCGVAEWTTDMAAESEIDIAVAARPQGATLLAVPTTGGTLTGFSLDVRMNMANATKVDINHQFDQVSASYVGNRVVSTAISGGSLYLHLLDDDLKNPEYVAKLPGTQVADPAFYTAEVDRVMPIGTDDGLKLYRFDEAFEPLDEKLVAPSKSIQSLAVAQVGNRAVAAWSTLGECYVMQLNSFDGGPIAYQPTACPSPRLAMNAQTDAGVMVFDSAEGLRMMHIQGEQMGGDAVVVREGSHSARTLFDGSNIWVSYIDQRGDVIVGFLDAKRHLVTMSLNGPQPQPKSYDLVMVAGAPWVFALDDKGYSAHRLCIEAQY